MQFPVLVCRADASAAQGAGHVARCLALAEAWRAMGGEARLWGRVELGFLRERADGAGITIADLPPGPTDCLVVDSYDPAVRVHGTVVPAAFRLLVEDGWGASVGGYDVSWWVRPDATDDAAAAERWGGARGLPVPDGLPRWTGAADGPFGVLVGGGDAGEAVAAVVNELVRDGSEVRVAATWAPPALRVNDSAHPWHALAGCRAVLTTPSTSALEAAVVGVPIVAVTLVENQTGFSDWLRQLGVPVLNRDALLVPTDVVRALLGARQIPGRFGSAGGIAAALAAAVLPPALVQAVGSAAPEAPFRLRPVILHDAALLYEWANDPDVRRHSGNRPAVTWHEHRRWFAGLLASPNRIAWVAEDAAGTPVGTIRFESRDGWRRATLSYLVAPQARGRGIGRWLVTSGMHALAQEQAATEVQATVNAGNEASHRIFRGLGWHHSADATGRVTYIHPTTRAA